MNRFLMIISILIVSVLAYTDARERLKELDEVAANTPAQVEMKPVFNNNAPEQKFERADVSEQKNMQPAAAGTSSNSINKNYQQSKPDIKKFQEKRNDDIFK